MGIESDFKKELKLRKEEVYRQANNNPGWPGWPIPEHIRDLLEKRDLIRTLGQEYGENPTEDNLDGAPDMLDDYIEFLPEEVAKHQESVLSQPVKTKKTGRKREKWSDWEHRLFNRRFNIVMFVAEHRKPDSKQMKWKRVTAEWNKSHPLDPLNPAQMARIYSRGLTEDGITLQVEAMSTLEAMRLLGDGHAMKAWRAGHPHARTIKSPLITIIVPTKGKGDTKK